MSQIDGLLNDEPNHSQGETEQPKLKRKEYEEILSGLQEELSQNGYSGLGVRDRPGLVLVQ